MAKVKLNQLLEMLQGGIGSLVFRQMPDGTFIVSGAPRRKKRKATQKQKDHWERFRMAANAARSLARQYPIYAKLAKGTWKSAYNFALSDWWHAPVIHQVKQQKGQILVKATDNIMVDRVQVTIRDEKGRVLERGEATRGRGNWWKYTPQTARRGGIIIAEARDLPQNVTRLVLE
jgi:hypothetical protein